MQSQTHYRYVRCPVCALTFIQCTGVPIHIDQRSVREAALCPGSGATPPLPNNVLVFPVASVRAL